MKWRTVVADDEPLSAKRMLRLLAKYQEEIEVIGIAEDGQKAVEIIDRLEPELIFLDVEMAHLSGLEVSRQMRHQPKVQVFFSASAGYRQEAEACGAFAYLSKPVGQDDMDALMTRIREYQLRQD